MAANITIDKLSKRYAHASTYALHNLSLSINAGEVYGFLGANGAGKSTTIRTLLNFIQPTKGTATIMGHDILTSSAAARRHVGYLAGEIALYGKMTGQQFLDYMSGLQPLKHPDYLPKLAERFQAQLDEPIKTLSKGNRQKIGLLQAFMHEPEVIILDEPTSGLDPLMQEAFFTLVREVTERGASVFASSHNFAEVQRMCDRVGFIREGKLIAEQTLADLAQKATHTFVITFTDPVPLTALQHITHAEVTAHTDHSATISMTGELTPLFAILAKHHVTRMEQQEVNLEQEFLRFYGKEQS